MQRAAHIILARGQWPHVPGVPQASSLARCGGPPALLVSAARTCMHGRGWCEPQCNPVDIEYLSVLEYCIFKVMVHAGPPVRL